MYEGLKKDKKEAPPEEGDLSPEFLEVIDGLREKPLQVERTETGLEDGWHIEEGGEPERDKKGVWRIWVQKELPSARSGSSPQVERRHERLKKLIHNNRYLIE